MTRPADGHHRARRRLNPLDPALPVEGRPHPLRRYAALSAWARGDQTAGPRLRFRTLNWMPVASIARPISPPSASISRTRWPFAVPPMAGLQGMCATVSLDIVQMPTREPKAGRRPGGLAARVPGADDDEVEGIGHFLSIGGKFSINRRQSDQSAAVPISRRQPRSTSRYRTSRRWPRASRR